MGKTYKTLKERFDYATVISNAYVSLFTRLTQEGADGKKFRDMEDILNSIWSTIPSTLKREKYKARGNISFWQKWEAVERQFDGGTNLVDKTEVLKRRVWAKMQILADLLFSQNIWYRTKIVDIFDERDFEIIEDEEVPEGENKNS